MTVSGSRQTAAIIGLAVAGWSVVLAASGLLMGQPRFLLLVAPLVPLGIVAVAMQARPMTLAFDGSDVVYRVMSSEKRIAKTEIAQCALVGQLWVFSDSAGAQLLAVPTARFDQAGMTALCATAGITLQAPDVRPIDQLRKEVRSGKWNRALAVGMLLLLVAGMAGAAYAQYSSREDLRRYRAAPVCTSTAPADTSTCRLELQAVVKTVDSHSSGATLHLSLTGIAGDYIAFVDYPAPNRGDTVQAELWNGEVRQVNGQPTGNNPTSSNNLDLSGAIAVIGLFALMGLIYAAISQYQLMRAATGLSHALNVAGLGDDRVQRLNPEGRVGATGLPPCGIQHQPKEQFFAHFDSKKELSGAAILAVIVAIPTAVFVSLAIAFSTIWWAGPAALGVLFYAEQMVELWRGNRDGGIYADDLHVAKIETSFLWYLTRKTYDRKSILEVRLASGVLTVVGVDGSTLFSTGLISDADQRRFADFVGGHVVEESPPSQADALAVPPTRTPEGVLPLSYRRAAGLLQAIGGLLLGLGVVNAAVRLPSTPTDRRIFTLELLAALVVYGAIYLVAGLMLARGRPASRELALYGGGTATAGVLVGLWLATTNPAAVAIFAVLFIPIYALVAYWLRQPLPKREALR